MKLSEIMKSHPRVTYLDKSTKCDRFVHAPLSIYYKDIKPRSNQRSTDPEDYRCKNPARWHFKSKRNARFPYTGNYCWSHLVSILYSMDNEVETKEHVKKFTLRAV